MQERQDADPDEDTSKRFGVMNRRPDRQRCGQQSNDHNHHGTGLEEPVVVVNLADLIALDRDDASGRGDGDVAG